MDYPKNKREARKWIRKHWAEFIYQSDMQFDANEHIASVWKDECLKIANRLGPIDAN